MGKGTRISFTLPAAKNAPRPREKAAPQSETPAPVRANAGILVVDDDNDTLDFVRLLLEKNGYTVSTASSAEQGLETFASDIFDLALVDMSLTGMDGIEFCRRIKGDLRGKRLPVYMFTARADMASRKRAKESGCDGYIIKPISMQDFLKTIEKALAGK
jgi:CheY-like chemotaxis protein